ncbi:WXG100 family type VII secretion target [Bacillus cereus ISP3191]|nr:conserved domain protein [Bacillus cereus biovar anthracis str. CI]EJQ91968.1 WXG100 family type VII secretion target [Bacillus cereus ISP3191]
MVQIKVTPEMLEEVANRASNTRIALESIHNNLCNEIDYLCSQWIGASNQQFVQMFNDARPKAFISINSIIQVEEDLKRIAENSVTQIIKMLQWKKVQCAVKHLRRKKDLMVEN